MLLRLYRSVGDIFLNSIAFTVINKNGKGGVVHISIVFGLSYMVRPEGSSETGLFKYFFNIVLRSP